MFAPYNHAELWNCTKACSLSGWQITVFGKQTNHTYGETHCKYALNCNVCTHMRVVLLVILLSAHILTIVSRHRRVKMQIINPILFQRKAGGRDDLELWVWNPVWIVPNLTWVHWKCVSGLSYGNVRNRIALIFSGIRFTLWWWGCLSFLLELTAN